MIFKVEIFNASDLSKSIKIERAISSSREIDLPITENGTYYMLVSESDKQATGSYEINLFCFLGCIEQPKTNVTFSVDMNDYNSAFTQVYISGSFNDWAGGANPLTDPDGDGIWSTIISLANGTYEYKFTIDNWADQEEFIPATQCTFTTEEFTNRIIEVIEDTEVCFEWESCIACGDAPLVSTITFSVDMNDYNSAFTQVYISGSFNGWAGDATPLTDPNGDGIWSTTISLVNGTYEYKFTIDNWADQEEFDVGQECTLTTGMFTNRIIEIEEDTAVCFNWNTCSSCTPINSKTEITFSVDLQKETIHPEGVFIAGSFNGWIPEKMELEEGTIYTITIDDIPPGEIIWKFLNGLEGWEISTLIENCGIPNSFGVFDRSTTITQFPAVIPTVCFNECTACEEEDCDNNFQQWSSSGEYSKDNNPNKIWAYGKKSNPTASEFELMSIKWGDAGWFSGNIGDGSPSITSGPILWAKDNANGLPVVRWTCPKSGFFSINSFFADNDSRGVNNNVFVTLNDSLLFTGNVRTGSQVAEFDVGNIYFNKNDHLDFVVKWDGSVNSDYGWTRASAVITQIDAFPITPILCSNSGNYNLDSLVGGVNGGIWGGQNVNDGDFNTTGLLGDFTLFYLINDDNSFCPQDTLFLPITVGSCDCTGTLNGSAILDACDNCLEADDPNFDNCVDCAGVANGTMIVDACGNCLEADDPNFDNCVDCAGVVNGTMVVDACGNCLEADDPNFDNCVDCAGVVNGTMVVDACGNCLEADDPNFDNCVDCAGVANGTMVVDACGNCLEADDPNFDNCVDCAGVANGTMVVDACGNCLEADDPNFDNCVDCAGVANGTKRLDACGNCLEADDPNFDNCVDCAGVANGTMVVDACGNCLEADDPNFDNCVDCAGVANGTMVVDACGNCLEADDPNFDNCVDCAGVANGTKRLDACGNCLEADDPNFDNCVDCAGVANGTMVVDACGNCLEADDPNFDNCVDCAGVVMVLW